MLNILALWVILMSFFSVIEAEGTTNKVLNPSAEIAGNFAAVGGALTRVTTSSLYGVRAYRAQTAANNEGASFTLDALPNFIHRVTIRARGTLPPSWDWSLDNATYTSPTEMLNLDNDWRLYLVEFPAVQANGSTLLYVRQNGAGAGDFNLDGIQVERTASYTTYCDGDQPGCEWNGAEHGSTSTRSVLARAGGFVKDLVDDLGFELISQFIGAGMHAIENHLQNYALLPGALWQNTKDEVRQFSILGPIRGDSITDFHEKREQLIELFTRDYLGQSALLRYSGANTVKEIPVRYTAGLDLGRIESVCETIDLRLLAEAPYWEQVGESAAILGTTDSLTMRIVGARLDGAWDDLGPPNVAGTYGAVYAIAVADDGTVYIGGDFQDFNNIPAADRIVAYNPQTGTYSALGTGAANGIVYALEIGADGTLYAGGSFTVMGGVANTSRIASWNGAAWSALGTGAADNIVYALKIGPAGNLYTGGSFTAMGGVANTAGIAYWDGAAWNAMVSGVAGVFATVFAVETLNDGTVYAGGSFTTIGGVTVNGIGEWDGTAWNDMAGGASGTVSALGVASDDTLFAGGAFTTIGGESISRIAKWNGSAWLSLGTGVNSNVQAIAIAPDGMLYAGGAFGIAGGLDLADRVARWNGYTWAHLDIDLPGLPLVEAITIANPDPVIASNYDVWLGFNTSGTAVVSGTTTVINGGTAIFFPFITVGRSGGAAATLTNIRNETTGKELLFDYGLLDGETLAVDLRPGQQSVESNFSGPRFDAVLENSDFSDFGLIPSVNGGANVISALVLVTGATIEAALHWRTAFKSLDD